MGYKYNKENILETGYHVLRKNGYHKVGINEILKEAGIPKGSFYNFFESKEDFTVQVIQQYGRSNRQWIEEFFQQEMSPLTLIKAFYKHLIDINEQDDYASGCLVNAMSNETGRLYDELAKASNESFESWIEVIAGIIKKGQDSGEITKEHTAKELAEFLHTGMYGTFARMKVTRSRQFMDQWFDMSMKFIEG
ncbi:MAG: TetR/AcrR family transcriptional regulator [Fulvivirga sp.]